MGLFTYIGRYCQLLAVLLNPSSEKLGEACQKPRWRRFDWLATQTFDNETLASWGRTLALGPSHPITRCASSDHLGACLGVPAMALDDGGGALVSSTSTRRTRR